jgi:hypothetical protein
MSIGGLRLILSQTLGTLKFPDLESVFFLTLPITDVINYFFLKKAHATS